MADIILERVEISSFMGISNSSPVLLDLGRPARKGKTVVSLEGDQGVCKTSTIMALLYLAGVTFDFDADNLINNKDKTLKAEQEFTYDGQLYRVRATKSKFTLERDVEGKWYNENEPKQTLRTLIGNLGVSPMMLKNLKGEKQIEWFQKTFSADEKTVKKEKKLKDQLAETKVSRRDANREYTRIKNALQLNELYNNYEANAKKFAKPKTIASAQLKFDDAQEAVNRLQRAKEKIANLRDEKLRVANDLADLQARIELLKKKGEDVDKSIKEGEAFVAEHVTDELDFKEAQKELMELSKTIAEQNEWNRVVEMRKEMEEYETLVQRADATKDEIAEEILKLTKKYLPDIKGLKIKLATGLDDEEEGIFYNGKTLAQLSESELWELFFLIWEQKNVQFVFVENISSLGSNAVETLNELAKKKIKIFTTSMDRKKQTMKISITDEVK